MDAREQRGDRRDEHPSMWDLVLPLSIPRYDDSRSTDHKMFSLALPPLHGDVALHGDGDDDAHAATYHSAIGSVLRRGGMSDSVGRSAEEDEDDYGPPDDGRPWPHDAAHSSGGGGGGGRADRGFVFEDWARRYELSRETVDSLRLNGCTHRTALVELHEGDMKELRVHLLGERKKLMRACADLRLAGGGGGGGGDGAGAELRSGGDGGALVVSGGGGGGGAEDAMESASGSAAAAAAAAPGASGPGGGSGVVQPRRRQRAPQHCRNCHQIRVANISGGRKGHKCTEADRCLSWATCPTKYRAGHKEARRLTALPLPAAADPAPGAAASPPPAAAGGVRSGSGGFLAHSLAAGPDAEEAASARQLGGASSPPPAPRDGLRAPASHGSGGQGGIDTVPARQGSDGASDGVASSTAPTPRAADIEFVSGAHPPREFSQPIVLDQEAMDGNAGTGGAIAMQGAAARPVGWRGPKQTASAESKAELQTKRKEFMARLKFKVDRPTWDVFKPRMLQTLRVHPLPHRFLADRSVARAAPSAQEAFAVRAYDILKTLLKNVRHNAKLAMVEITSIGGQRCSDRALWQQVFRRYDPVRLPLLDCGRVNLGCFTGPALYLSLREMLMAQLDEEAGRAGHSGSDGECGGRRESVDSDGAHRDSSTSGGGGGGGSGGNVPRESVEGRSTSDESGGDGESCAPPLPVGSCDVGRTGSSSDEAGRETELSGGEREEAPSVPSLGKRAVEEVEGERTENAEAKRQRVQ